MDKPVGVSDVIEQIVDLLNKLDLDFAVQIIAILDNTLPRIAILDKLPGYIKVLVVPIFANTFLHQVIDVLNGTEYDCGPARAIVLNWTRKLFGLSTWEPKWLYLPFE